MPKKRQTSSQARFQEEQLRLLNLIYQELTKINANIAAPAQALSSQDSDELDAYE